MSEQSERSASTETDHVEFVTASLPALVYALELGHVSRTGAFETVTPVPETDAVIDGVTELDGRVTVVVDASALLLEEPREPTETDELIVLERASGKPIALRTPRGVDFVTVSTAAIEPVTAATTLPASLEPSMTRAVVTDSETGDSKYVLDVAGVASAITV